MSLLLHNNSQANEAQRNGGSFTASEIERQPSTWQKVWEKIQQETEGLKNFLDPIRNISDLHIVLTGAGSSAFIGDTIASIWLQHFSCPVQAIPTTDLVTHFNKCIPVHKPLLLISFARSGNSPESTAVVQKANALCGEVYHLIITCNPNGELARMDKQDNTQVFLLPSEAEDKSLAMTNSFTSMALSGSLIPRLITGHTDTLPHQIELLCSYGRLLIEEHTSALYKAAQSNFNRIVFLGSGANWGTAEESHLKVQELTNGNVIGKFDSFLGFRHGPKAIINDETLLVYLLSNSKDVLPYEKDLIEQVAQHDNIDLTTLAIAESNCPDSDIDICLDLEQPNELEATFWAILCTLPAQIIGFHKSLLLGYNPDNPSPNGTISRVVEGVTIYDSPENSLNQ